MDAFTREVGSNVTGEMMIKIIIENLLNNLKSTVHMDLCV